MLRVYKPLKMEYNNTMAKHDGLNNSVIFDFETLSQNQNRGVVVNMAMLNFSETRFTGNYDQLTDLTYSFDELVENTHFIKFNIEEQVSFYNRKIDKSTLEWWNNQNEEAKKQLIPSEEDVSISKLYDFFVLNKGINVKKVYTRGNTFDPIIFENIMIQTGKTMPYEWWEVRDTRSTIEGLSWGSDLKNSFMPPDCKNFLHHDPRHDIALDVMRMQTLVQAINS